MFWRGYIRMGLYTEGNLRYKIGLGLYLEGKLRLKIYWASLYSGTPIQRSSIQRYPRYNDKYAMSRQKLQ